MLATKVTREAQGLPTEGAKFRPQTKGERVKNQTDFELMQFHKSQCATVFTPGKKALMPNGKLRSLTITQNKKKTSDKENALKKQLFEDHHEAGVDDNTPPAFMRATVSASARKLQVFKGSSDAPSIKLFSNVTINGAKSSKK